jgi:hypothetical protein
MLRWLRRATGTGLGFLGTVLGILAGLFCFVWTLYVLFQVFGAWAILVGFLFAPITYVAGIFIVWFAAGVFPLLLLLPYFMSWLGLALASIGGHIHGD